MTSSDWIGLVAIGVTAVTALILAQRKNIESLVGQRLNEIQASVKELLGTQSSHGEQLVRHETILELAGLTERRKPGNYRATEGNKS